MARTGEGHILVASQVDDKVTLLEGEEGGGGEVFSNDQGGGECAHQTHVSVMNVAVCTDQRVAALQVLLP